MKILAEIPPSPSSDFMGNWFFALCALVAFIGAILAIASYFATRREVDKMDDRITKIEDNIVDTERRLNEAGEKRTVKLHNRINRVQSGVDRIAGKLGVHLASEDHYEE